MKKIVHFLVYNNTIPLMFGILFLGAGATFAASPEAREAVVQETQRVVSVDNSYLLNTTITDATVDITVKGVTEDADSYYVEYDLVSIEMKDAVWQPTTRTYTLVVSKDSVMGRDLGLYAEEELSEVHGAEVRQLKEVQKEQRSAGITYKAVATEYNGLVGQFFDPSQEVFPGYDPLISPNVGIPLTKEQEAAHEEVRRLLEEQKAKESGTAENQLPQDEHQGPVPNHDDPPAENIPPSEEPTPPEPTPEQPPETPPESVANPEPTPTEPVPENQAI